MREPYNVTLADGTVLSLAYTFKSMRHFEKLTGQHFFGDTSTGKIGIDYLVGGFTAGLLWKQSTIKPEEVDGLIERHLASGGDLPTLVAGLLEALKKAGVLKTGEEAPPDRPTQAADAAL
jgi:hypothetical protein